MFQSLEETKQWIAKNWDIDPEIYAHRLDRLLELENLATQNKLTRWNIGKKALLLLMALAVTGFGFGVGYSRPDLNVLARIAHFNWELAEVQEGLSDFYRNQETCRATTEAAVLECLTDREQDQQVFKSMRETGKGLEELRLLSVKREHKEYIEGFKKRHNKELGDIITRILDSKTCEMGIHEIMGTR